MLFIVYFSSHFFVLNDNVNYILAESYDILP